MIQIVAPCEHHLLVLTNAASIGSSLPHHVGSCGVARDTNCDAMERPALDVCDLGIHQAKDHLRSSCFNFLFFFLELRYILLLSAKLSKRVEAH